MNAPPATRSEVLHCRHQSDLLGAADQQHSGGRVASHDCVRLIRQTCSEQRGSQLAIWSSQFRSLFGSLSKHSAGNSGSSLPPQQRLGLHTVQLHMSV